jgi:hypothetical protein
VSIQEPKQWQDSAGHDAIQSDDPLALYANVKVANADQYDPTDTTSIGNMSKLIGRGSSSVNRAAARDSASGTDAARQQARTAAEQREQLRIAQWNATQVRVGGVTMTNAQVLAILKEINKDPDKFAQDAVNKGYIKDTSEEKEKLKREIKRLEELNKREQAGEKLSPEELQERNNLYNGPVGQVMKDAGAQMNALENRGAYNPEQEIQNANNIQAKAEQQLTSDNIVKAQLNGETFKMGADSPTSPVPAGNNLRGAAFTVDGEAIKTAAIKPVFSSAANPTNEQTLQQPTQVASVTVKVSGMEL